MSDAAAFASILTQLSKLVKTLSPAELQSIAEGDTRLLLAPRGSKVVTPLNVAEVAADVRRLSSENEVIRLLDSDKRLNPAALRTLSDELNITLPPTAKAKSAMVLHIAQTASAYRQRTHGGI